MALRIGLMFADGVSAVLVFLLISRVRFGDGEWVVMWERLGIDIRLAALLFGIAWVAMLWYQGLYRLRVRWQLLSEARAISWATILVAALTLSTLFLVHQGDVSRLFLLSLFLVEPLVTFAGRAALRTGFNWLRQHGHYMRYMLVAGTGRLAQDFADRVENRAGLGLRIVGHLSIPEEQHHEVTRPILGTLDEMQAVFHASIVDEVAVCLPPESASQLDLITRLAADEGKTVRIPVDPLAGMLPYPHEEEFEGFLVRSLVHDGNREAGLVFKRLIDIVAAAIGLVVTSPLLVGAAILIRLREGPPVLFGQIRVGLHGRPFTMYKFRTMVPDAEARLHEVAHLNERSGAAFKARGDPRITPFGRTLRRTSIDELPQLWNVLKGEMSLVGPRPPLPHEVADYDIWHRRRLSMKPGITGLWQVEARNESEFDRWVERDLTYIDGWSLWLDVRILARTIPAILARTGR